MYSLDRMKQAELMPPRGSQEYSNYLKRQMSEMQFALHEREQKKLMLLEAEILESRMHTLENELFPVHGEAKHSQTDADFYPYKKQNDYGPRPVTPPKALPAPGVPPKKQPLPETLMRDYLFPPRLVDTPHSPHKHELSLNLRPDSTHTHSVSRTPITKSDKEALPGPLKQEHTVPRKVAAPTKTAEESMSKQDYLFEVLQCMWGNLELIEDTLQPPGIDINGRTKEGLTPLHLAVTREPVTDKPDILRLLVKYGAKPNIVTTKDKQTALHIAARKGDKTAAATLIELGADTTVKDKYGETPFDLAVRLDHVEVADIIKYRRTLPTAPSGYPDKKVPSQKPDSSKKPTDKNKGNDKGNYSPDGDKNKKSGSCVIL